MIKSFRHITSDKILENMKVESDRYIHLVVIRK